jgi:hypothetical protein
MLSSLVFKDQGILSKLIEEDDDGEAIPAEPEKHQNIGNFKKYGAFVWQKENRLAQ